MKPFNLHMLYFEIESLVEVEMKKKKASTLNLKRIHIVIEKGK